MPKSAAAGAAADPRPYHHGDLRRALILAAETVLERDGPQALSLRAVAREAGVSPAAPYHHFKDKSELLDAIAEAGFQAIAEAVRAALEQDPEHRATTIGLAYVKFARTNPALYRVMYDCSRNRNAMPDKSHRNGGGYHLLQGAMVRAGVDPSDEIDLSLWCIAAWCAAHGIAEMVNFAQFAPTIEALGGEDRFIESLIDRIAPFSGRRPGDPAGGRR